MDEFLSSYNYLNYHLLRHPPCWDWRL